MAFTVTARQSGSAGATAGQTFTTDSATPTTNSLLLVFAGVESNTHSTAHTWQTPTGGGWTYTNVATSAQFDWDTSPDFDVSGSLWRAAVGVSALPHTVTVDAWSGTQTGYYSAVCCDITGHNTTTPVVQSKTGGASKAGGNAESGSVTLDTVPATGNLVVVGFAAGNDVSGAFTAPTIGGQAMTQLHNLTPAFCHTGLWYRVITGAETNATITCSDLGESVGNFATVAVEIAAAGSGSSFTMGLPTETDAALNLALSKAVAFSLATETDQALGLSVSKATTFGLATSTEQALSMAWSKNLPLGIAVETDAALPWSTSAAGSMELGLATESDTALGITLTKLATLGQSTESDTALPMAWAKELPLGVAAETDTAGALAVAKTIQFGTAAEVDAALAMLISGAYTAPDSVTVTPRSFVSTAAPRNSTSTATPRPTTSTATARSPE